MVLSHEPLDTTTGLPLHCDPVSDRPCNRLGLLSLQRVIVRFAAVSALFAVCLTPFVALAQTDGSVGAESGLAGPPNSRSHTVGEGESLASIAKAYGISIDSLKSGNPGLSVDRLEVGQLLLILPGDGVLHAVRSGDTVKKVADRYKVKTEAIVEANKVAEDDKLESGLLLFIPANTAAAVGADTDSDGNDDPRTYKVQAGDTLWTISQRFGVEPSLIMLDNEIKDPKSVVPGVRLRILPAKGVESTILKSGESMNDLAARYQIDLGALLDYNQLDTADAAKAGARIVIPQTHARPVTPTVAAASASPALTKSQVAVVNIPASELALPSSDKGQQIAALALKHVGARYVFGGTSPSGFDCSGFVYYVHRAAGVPVGRTLWQQMNAGARVAKSQLQVGDEVFFANTYMPGLSHAGIYIGEGKFVHANNERTGVVVSKLEDDYWAQRYVGASRIRG